jgi:hypothetical protein
VGKSLPVGIAPVLQSAERAVLNTVQCGFESHAGHMAKKNYVGLQAVNMGFEAHLTLIYTGDLSPHKEALYEEIIDSLGKRIRYHVFNLDRNNIEMFGPNHDIPVLRLNMSANLNDLRNELIDRGIRNVSEYSFNPHISLKLDNHYTVEIPPRVRLVGLGLY